MLLDGLNILHLVLLNIHIFLHGFSMGFYGALEMFDPSQWPSVPLFDCQVHSWLRRSGRASPEIPEAPIRRCGERTASVGPSINLRLQDPPGCWRSLEYLWTNDIFIETLGGLWGGL